MDAPEDANPIALPSPDHSQESFEFRYIDDLPPIKPESPLHHTPFSDAQKSDVPFERGLQIRSCEAGVSYTYQANNALFEQLSRNCTLDDTPQGSSAYDCNSHDFDEEQISSTIQRLVTSSVSEIEGPRCDLESLNRINIADAPKGLIQNSLDPTLPLIRPNLHGAVDSQHEIRYQTFKHKAATETELMQDRLMNFATMASNLNEMQHMLRGSLDYDMDNVNSHMRIMPAIDSHMNNVWTSTRQPSQSNSAPSSSDLSTSQHSHQMSSLYKTPQRDLHHSQDIWTNQLDYFSQSLAPIIDEGFNQNRSNKTRRKSAPVGEGAGCKNCKCKKSTCLKLYCECFAAGIYCMGSCSCQNCYNKPTHKEIVLAARKASETRNPLAFAPKVNRSADSALTENGFDPNKTPASTGHIRGCNCKKSKCQKKYCECYENGVGCSIKCRCTGCDNVYGRNPCYSELGPETGTQINESCERLMAEKVSQVTETLNNEGHPNSTATTPTPSSSAYRSNASLGGSSKRKRRSNFIISDASGLNASQRLNERSDILHNQLNFEDEFKSNNPELQMPNIHQVGDGSSTRYISSWFTYINNSSSSASEMIHYDPSPPFPPPPNSLQHPTPHANPTTPGNFVQHRK